MANVGIILPDQAIVDNWTKITENPILDTYHNIVPNSVLITYQTDEKYPAIQEVLSDISAYDSCKCALEVQQIISKIDRYIAFTYPLRSTTKNLIQQLEGSKAPPAEVAKTARKMMESFSQKFIQARVDCYEAVNKISKDFHNHDTWDKGLYSDYYIDQVCILITKLFTFGKLCPMKTALSDDLSILNKLSKTTEQEQDLFPFDIRMWMSNPNSSKNDLLGDLSDVPNEDVNIIFNAFWKRIEHVINNDISIDTNTETSYLVAFLFMLDFYVSHMNEERKEKKRKYVLQRLDSTVVTFLTNQRNKYPSILLAYDLCFDFNQFLSDGVILLKDTSRKTYEFNLFELLTQLQTSFSNLMRIHTSLISKKEQQTSKREEIQRYFDLIIKTTKYINKAINSFMHLVIDSHNRLAPSKPEKDKNGNLIKLPPSQYEMVIRNLDDSILESMVHFTSISCKLRNTLLNDLPNIEELLSNYIEESTQDFVINQLKLMLIRSSKVSQFFESDVLKLREIISYIEEDESVQNKRNSKIVIQPSKVFPQVSLLQLLRIQLQVFINPQSKLMPKSLLSKSISKDDLNSIRNFLNISEYWESLSDFKTFISKQCDYSGLFFKEYCINLYQSQISQFTTSIKYFPVTTSIPYVLIEYIISHTNKHDLIDTIYYPLSIYDSAAALALKHFESRSLYEEIKAESQICLLTIAKMISDFAFNSLKNYSYDKFFDKNNENLLKDKNKFVEVSALKIASVLQQNKLSLLGQHVSIKSLFSDRLNELFANNITQILNFVAQHGILSIIVFDNIIQILKDTHQILLEFDVPLDPFEQILQKTLSLHSINSFNSLFFQLIIKHLKRNVLKYYIAQINPLRLYPPQNEIDSVSQYFNNRKNIPNVLKQTTQFVSIEHFKTLIKICGEGSVFLLFKYLIRFVNKIVPNFVNFYSEQNKRFKRIVDLPLGSGWHKSYDRFEGAYKPFLKEQQVDDLFCLMQTIGNLLIISNMSDLAYALYRASNNQTQAFFFNIDKNNIDEINQELFTIFDDDFKNLKDWFNGIKPAPDENEVMPPFFVNVAKELMNLLNENVSLFEETSENILDLPSLTGFASVWSVLEFIFVLKDIMAPVNKDGVAMRYGCGVTFTAAIVLILTNQVFLSKAICISTKIEHQKMTGITSLNEAALNRFLNVSKLEKTSLEYALATLNSLFKNE